MLYHLIFEKLLFFCSKNFCIIKQTECYKRSLKMRIQKTFKCFFFLKFIIYYEIVYVPLIAQSF